MSEAEQAARADAAVAAAAAAGPIDLATMWRVVEANGRSPSVVAACVRLVRRDLTRIDLSSPFVVALLTEHLGRADAPCDALRTFSFELLTQLDPLTASGCFRAALAHRRRADGDSGEGPLAYAMARFLRARGEDVPDGEPGARSGRLLTDDADREGRKRRQKRLAGLIRADGRDPTHCGNCGSTEKVRVLEVVPLALGGAETAGNLVSLCKGCRGRVPRLRVGARALARAAAAQRANAGAAQSLRSRQLALFGG